jgi:hypothetical protein
MALSFNAAWRRKYWGVVAQLVRLEYVKARGGAPTPGAQLESDEFNHVVDVLYDAAIEPGSWMAAIAALCRYIGASATHFVIWDKRKNAIPLSVLGGEVHEQAEPLYVAHYGALNRCLAAACTARGVVATYSGPHASRAYRQASSPQAAPALR